MVLLTQSGGILGPFAKILGWIFNSLFELAGNFGIYNIGLTIMLFTIVVKLLMLPLTIKQTKFSKLSSIMNPELTAIQKKYSGKSDQASIQKMQEEQRAVYEKYGTSPTGGCLNLLIQMPILFALYRVIQNIPAYVLSVKNLFINMLSGPNGLMAQENFGQIMSENFTSADYTSVDATIDVLNMFSVEQWEQLKTLFPNCASLITQNVDSLYEVYDFFGINLAVPPVITSIAVLIPILTAFTQWLSMKTASIGNNNSADSDNPAAQSMKTMNTIMPFMTAFLALSLPAGLGFYWIVNSIAQTVQQLCLNLYFNNIDMDEVVKKNIEKANEKRAKQGLPPNSISSKINTNTKNLQSRQEIVDKLEETKRKNLEKVEEIKKSSNYYNDGIAEKGSLASKANMVAKYNEKNKK